MILYSSNDYTQIHQTCVNMTASRVSPQDYEVSNNSYATNSMYYITIKDMLAIYNLRACNYPQNITSNDTCMHSHKHK